MAEAILLGYDSVSRGDGSIPLAKGSYTHIRNPTPGGFATAVTSDVTSIVMTAGSATDLASLADPPRFLVSPAGGDRATRVYTGHITITVPDATKWFVASLYGFASAAATWNINVLDVDASLALLFNFTSPSIEKGLWARVAFKGSIRLHHQASVGACGVFVSPYVAHLAGAVPPTAFGHFAI